MFELPELYFVSGAEFDLRDNHFETIELALKGGARVIQLREKNLSDSVLLEYAEKIRKLTLEYNALFIVNDRIDIAILSKADGIHLGQDDLSIKEIRKITRKKIIVGKSTHSPEQALKAEKEGADYIGVGPVFWTASKKNVCDPVGLDYVKWASENIKIPFVAIGGIKLHNVEKVLENGAKSIAVITEITQSKNPEKTARDFIEKIKKGH
ncbi:MAG: thiamine phosphate synthase [Candidatus Muiribacteriota bacterium]